MNNAQQKHFYCNRNMVSMRNLTFEEMSVYFFLFLCVCGFFVLFCFGAGRENNNMGCLHCRKNLLQIRNGSNLRLMGLLFEQASKEPSPFHGLDSLYADTLFMNSQNHRTTVLGKTEVIRPSVFKLCSMELYPRRRFKYSVNVWLEFT